MSDKHLYLWYTDLHLNKKFPWTVYKFIRHIKNKNPKGVFLTGDIANGLTIDFYLRLIAKNIECPIYFVLGNHDYHFSSIDKIHDKLKKLCQEYPNLIWMTNSDVISLSDEVGLIGTEGWYDVHTGDSKYLRYTLDWCLTEDFRKLSSMNERVHAFRQLSQDSCSIIKSKLERALELDYKNIYILTHVPCWPEATRDMGTFMEKFWLPYNVNLSLGKTIEETMKGLKKKHVTVLSGHTHSPEYIRVARNIDCQVGNAKLFNINSQVIYL